MAITTLRLEARITLTRQCPGFIPIGRLYCRGRQNAGYQRRSSGKSGIVVISGFICLFYECPRFIPGIDFSDHLNYWQHDIPAIMITDTAFYRNKQYHLPGDTADRLNYQKMAQVVNGVITLLYNSK